MTETQKTAVRIENLRFPLHMSEKSSKFARQMRAGRK